MSLNGRGHMDYLDLFNGYDPEFPRLTSEQLKEFLAIAQPKVKGLGKIQFFGTSGNDTNNLEALKEMFYNPQNYDIMNQEEEQNTSKDLASFFKKNPYSSEEGLLKQSVEKQREGEILQLLCRLKDLGFECFNEEGIPILTTIRRGQINREYDEENLIERQRQWDLEYGPESQQLYKHATPARPSKEDDERNTNLIKQLQMPLKKQDEKR